MPYRIDIDTTGLEAAIDKIEADVKKAIRPAAQAGAQVLYNEVKLNVSRIKSLTGNLNESIYQVFSQSKSVESGDGYSKAVYEISYNHTKAPHGYLIEKGRLQRYRYYQNAQGQVRPMVRPGMDGREKPSKRASQAVKDAYYVTLPKSIHIPGKAFVRNAQDKTPQAVAAMIATFNFVMNGAFNGETDVQELFK